MHAELVDEATRFPVGEGTADEVKPTEEKEDGEDGGNADGDEAGQWRPEVKMPRSHGKEDCQTPAEEPAKQGKGAKDSTDRNWRHDGSGKRRWTFRQDGIIEVYAPISNVTEGV